MTEAYMTSITSTNERIALNILVIMDDYCSHIYYNGFSNNGVKKFITLASYDWCWISG